MSPAVARPRVLTEVPLTSEELLAACEIAGLPAPVGRPLVPVDREDPALRQLLIGTALRSLAGRRLVTTGGDGLVLDADVAEALRGLAHTRRLVVLQAFAEDAGGVEIRIAPGEAHCVALSSPGPFDHVLFVMPPEDASAAVEYAAHQTAGAASAGAASAYAGDDDGLEAEELCWQHDAGGTAHLVGDDGELGDAITADEIAERLLAIVGS